MTSGVDLERHLKFSPFRTTRFLRCCFSVEFDLFFRMSKIYGAKAFACLSNMVHIVGNMRNSAHLRSHTRTPRNTTLHHPSTHSDNDSDPTHNKSHEFRRHRSVSQLFGSCFAYQWMPFVDTLVANNGVGRGSSWSSLDLETLQSDASSGKSAGAIAKDRGWPSCSLREGVAALNRGGLAPRHVGGVERRLAPELLDEICECVEGERCVNPLDPYRAPSAGRSRS